MSNRARKITELPKVTSLSVADLFIVESVGTSNSTTSAMTANSLIHALANVDIRGRYATSTVAGVIKVGDGLGMTSNGYLYVDGIQLAANTTNAGVIKVGGGLVMDSNGYLSALNQVFAANSSFLGSIKVGDGLSVDTNGVLSVTTSGHDLPQTLVENSPYAIQATDRGHHLYCSNAELGFFTIQVPNNADVPVPVGTFIKIVASETAGVYVYAPDSGTTRVFASGLTYASGGYDIPAGGTAELIKTETNTWRLTGIGVVID
jgi:hypothetical protein